MLTIVGLDVATKTGWCRRDSEGRYTTGIIDTSPQSKTEPEGVRYWRMDGEGWKVVLRADAVVFEQPFSNSKRTATVLGGLIAVILVCLEEEGIPYVFVPAPTLKAFGRKHGCAGKAEMQGYAAGALGRPDLTDDEADAWWLVKYYEENLTGDEEV